MPTFEGKNEELAQHPYFDEIHQLFVTDSNPGAIVIDTYLRSLTEGSVRNAVTVIKNETGNERSRARKTLQILFSQDVDTVAVDTNSGFAGALRSLLERFLEKDLTPGLRKYLSALREKAESVVEEGVQNPQSVPRVTASNRNLVQGACVYAYTYPWFLAAEGASADTRIPIKIGYAEYNGEARVGQQVGTGSPERPMILMACLPRDGATAEGNEGIIHDKLDDSGYERTKGGGTEWFEISVNDLFAVAEELDLGPLVVTPSSDWK